MKKRKKSSQKTIDETFEIVDDLLTLVKNFKEIPADEKWLVHHMLISLIPTVQSILDRNEFSKTDKIIERIKDAAEIVAPASHVAAYG